MPRDDVQPIVPAYVYEYDAIISPRTHVRHNHAAVAAAKGASGVTPRLGDDSEDAIERLMSMGFARREAEDALLQSGNDVKVATVRLIEQKTPSATSPRAASAGADAADVEL